MTVELVAEEEAAAEAVAAAPAALPRRGGARQKEGEARAWGTAPGLLVGRKVRVLWAEDGKWYEGSVGGFSGGDGKHKVRYADSVFEGVFGPRVTPLRRAVEETSARNSLSLTPVQRSASSGGNVNDESVLNSPSIARPNTIKRVPCSARNSRAACRASSLA